MAELLIYSTGFEDIAAINSFDVIFCTKYSTFFELSKVRHVFLNSAKKGGTLMHGEKVLR